MIISVVRSIEWLGKTGIGLASATYAIVDLFIDAITASFRTGRAPFSSFASQISRQILYTGVEAFWLVGIVAFLCGNTIIIQAMTNMPKFGVTEYFGNILIIAVVRELGPFFTSLVVIGRSGAALAAHVATMKVNKEVSALQVMGIDPVHFLVMPALVGMVISMICLNFYFDMIAIIGGLLVAKITVYMPFQIFVSKVIEALTLKDILASLLKSILFGGIIAVIACHYGLAVKTVREVPQAAIKAVVGSMSITILINVVMTVIFYVT